MRIHLIAIGGAVMHNLALALQKMGHQVTGSDDEIFEPSFSRLKNAGLLPAYKGWKALVISTDVELVILGMHARKDNPELLQAQKLGLKIMSFPEFMYENTREKTRVVVAGSHGKTTTTAMIMHVLRENNYVFDYLVGSKLEGFDTMVGLDDKSEIAIFEGDEYFTSPIDQVPKFLWYQPKILIITGIAWDHINVYATFQKYLETFQLLISKLKSDDILIYYEGDKNLAKIASDSNYKALKIPYNAHPAEIINGETKLRTKSSLIPISIFGTHNLQNLSAAREACRLLGIKEEKFYPAISTFSGTAKRLQKLIETEKEIAFLDFAHSPSKVKATIEAVKEQYPQRKLIACLELHTFSSLTRTFLEEYRHTMHLADIKIIYYDEHTIEHKMLEKFSKEDIHIGFQDTEIHIFSQTENLVSFLEGLSLRNSSLLFMSSGNFSGLDLTSLVTKLYCT